LAFLVAGAGFAGALGLTFLLNDPARMPFHLSEYVDDVRSWRGMLVTAIIFLFALHFGAEQTFYPALLRDQCGLSQFGVGIVFAYSGFLIGIVARTVKEGRGGCQGGHLLLPLRIALRADGRAQTSEPVGDVLLLGIFSQGVFGWSLRFQGLSFQ
jgi:hypothetical protein